MNVGQTVFSQVFSFADKYQFDKCVLRYNGNYKVRSFRCWEQFLAMGFAQLTYRESLRDIEVCLGALGKKIYHMGIKSKVAKSTLADANENRDWRIYADFAQILIGQARVLYKDDNEFNISLDGAVYALDSTTIDLCLNLFPWAKFRKAKGAVKMHTLLDLRGNIPTFILISDGLLHDVNVLDELAIEPGATYIMDRGYIDWERLFWIEANNAHFITRAKTNLAFKRAISTQVDKNQGLICDQTITLKNTNARETYPEKLRRIVYNDKITGKRLVFLTNNFILPAITIAALYKQRWQIELFFKWIKQHLRLKAFYGTSRNAVYTQIWIAISTYVLIAIIKKQIGSKMSLYTMLQVLSLSLLEKTPVNQLFAINTQLKENINFSNQLTMFDL
jgi:hypothetical protein